MTALSRHVVAEWVRAQRTSTPVAKLILQLAFDHAGPQEDDRWVCWVGSNTLAWEACLAEGPNGARTVRRHLSDLEEAGVIKREERNRSNGSQTTNRIVLLVPPDLAALGGRTPESGGGGLASPPQKPHEEAPPEAKDESAPASEKKVALPAGFPDELLPHLRAAYRVLRDLAERHAAKEVNVCALAQLVMANHRKPLVLAAHECAAHWEGKGGIKDAVAAYRNWLRNADTLAVIEPLDAEGRTTQITRAGGLRDSRDGGGDAKSRARMENQRAQLERFAARERATAQSPPRLELTA